MLKAWIPIRVITWKEDAHECYHSGLATVDAALMSKGGFDALRFETLTVGYSS